MKKLLALKNYCYNYILVIFYMAITLKYQSEIEQFNLSIDCLDKAVEITADMESFRFSFDPMENELNFLPNVVFDRLRKSKMKYSELETARICKRCAASFYTSTKAAVDSWNKLTPSIRAKLGYSHIASGVLSPADGMITTPNDIGHFDFYESTAAQLHSKFTNIFSLS